MFKKFKNVRKVFDFHWDNPSNTKIIKNISNTTTFVEQSLLSLSSQAKAIIDLTTETNISPKLSFFWKKELKRSFNFGTKWPKNSQTMTSEETHITIEFNESFEVHPLQSLEIIGMFDFIENMTIPFTAKLVITGRYIKDFYGYDNNSLSAKEIAVRLPGVESSKVIDATDKSITLAIDGYFTASFVLTTHTSIKNGNNDERGINEKQICYRPNNLNQCVNKCIENLN